MGSDEHVVESYLSDDPEEALREFLTFIRAKLKGVIVKFLKPFCPRVRGGGLA